MATEFYTQEYIDLKARFDAAEHEFYLLPTTATATPLAQLRQELKHRFDNLQKMDVPTATLLEYKEPPPPVPAQRFVLGFMFNLHGEDVVLINQAGHLNGIGGPVTAGENGINAMTRHFLEKTGVTYTDWQYMGEISMEIDVWRAFNSDASARVCSRTPEQVYIMPVEDVMFGNSKSVFDLYWLLPMLLTEAVFRFNVEYK